MPEKIFLPKLSIVEKCLAKQFMPAMSIPGAVMPGAKPGRAGKTNNLKTPQRVLALTSGHRLIMTQAIAHPLLMVYAPMGRRS